MQNWRQFFCTLLAEGFWEIVGAHQSQTKFIFSDDPATVYNCDHYPASQMCQFPLDPHIFERGTRIIFPLDRDNCLLISHIEHSKEPKRSKARLHRRNARAYDRTIISFLDVHRSRELTSVEVATINYVIKRRAVRYTAAGSEGDLNPESQIGDPSWCNIDAIFQHDGFPRKLAGGEMMIKYEDESILSSNEYGEHSLVPGWFVRQRSEIRGRRADIAICEPALRFAPCGLRSTLHHAHMPLCAVVEQRAVARDQRGADLARGRGDDAVERIARGLARQIR